MDTSDNHNAGSYCLCGQFGHFCDNVRSSMWNNVTELVDHMDSCNNWLTAVVDGAAVDPQWDWVVHLSKKTSGLVRGLLDNNQLTTVLELCPACPVRDNLAGLLLMACIRYSQEIPVLLHLHKGLISDSQLMDAIQFAAHLQDESAFLQLIRACPRCRCVFKQKFVHHYSKENLQSVCEGGEGGWWLYRTLYEGGEKDLALFVAAYHPCEKALIAQFCWDEIANFDLKQDQFRLALGKLYEYSVGCYQEFVELLYQSPGKPLTDRSFLFCQSIRLKEYDLVFTLCKLGVSKKDLKFVASWLLSGDADCEMFSKVCGTLQIEGRKWLKLYAAKFTMNQYFMLQSDASLETFIKHFPHNNLYNAGPVYNYLFKKIISKCFELDCADCFIRLCMKFCGFGVQGTCWIQYDDTNFVYACTSAISARPHFIFRMFEFQKEGKIRLGSTGSSDFRKLFFLVDFAVMKRAWHALPFFLSDVEEDLWKGLKLLEKCVHDMLHDQSMWPGMAPVLNQWIIENSMRMTKLEVYTVQERFGKEHWPFSLSTLRQWCVDNGHLTLAFFLALASGDWELMEMMAASFTTLELHPWNLWDIVALAADKGLFSLGAAMLKISPMNAEVVHSFTPFKGTYNLLKVCEDQKLFDWAVVLSCHKLIYVLDHARFCQNQAVLNWILTRFTIISDSRSSRWTIVRELMTRCTDSETLKEALKNVVKCSGPVDIVEALMSRVDPVACVEIGLKDGETVGEETLLFVVVHILYRDSSFAFKDNFDTILKTIRLFLASGLSTVQRITPPRKYLNCPLRMAMTMSSFRKFDDCHLEAVKMMLGCGTFSNKTLNKIAIDPKFQHRLINSEAVSEEWKEAYRRVEAAAATPCRLQHLARLAVSHSVGCQPGRADRINKLPLPQVLKDKINFNDVLKKEGKDDEQKKEDGGKVDKEGEDFQEEEDVEEEEDTEEVEDFEEEEDIEEEEGEEEDEF